MDRLLKMLLLPQDKANHFVWSVVLMDVVLGLSLLADHLFDLNLGFMFLISFSFIVSAAVGILKEVRDYKTKQGTPSFYDILANFFGWLTIFAFAYFVLLAYTSVVK